MVVMREPPPFHFVVDRPFFMAIRERQTGLILFLGAISDPRVGTFAGTKDSQTKRAGFTHGRVYFWGILS
jgi:hypothetical protein